MQPKVSIITVNFNGVRLLNDFIESVKKLNYENIELIFVDNASTDGSVEYIRKNYPGIKIIDNKINLGFSAANNIAADEANGKYLFFLNNDTRIDSETVSDLVTKMSVDSNLGICGCRMMSYDGREFFHAGIGIDIFGYPVMNNRVFYSEGSAFMIRKELFKHFGGFDEKYFMFHEDVDLSWRTWLCGYSVEVCDRAVVYHMLGASAGGNIKGGQYQTTFLRRYLSERNNIRTLLKTYGFLSLVFILPLYFLVNVAEIIMFLVLLRPRVSFCYIRAYMWNIVNFRDTLFCRSIIQKKRKISDKEIFNKMYKGIGKITALRQVKLPHFD